VSDVAPGTHSYTAVFTPGTDAFEPSTSGAQEVTVDPIATTTDLSAVATGRRVDLTAAVVPGSGTASPPGAVQFLDGETSLGNIAVVDGEATLTVPRATVGEHTYRAVYVSSSGDYLGSQDQATLAVGASATATSLATAVSGRKVTLTSTVTAPDGTTPLTGTVRFFEGSTPRGTATLGSGGTARLVLTGVTPGRHTYRAVFTSTNPEAAGSTSPTRTVTVAQDASRTSITAPGTVKAGARPKVVVSVKVGTANATGSVRVTLNGKAVATVKLTAGRASVVLPALKAGRAKIVASYLGTATTAPSSASRTITVTRA
jgi:hypothetical protein